MSAEGSTSRSPRNVFVLGLDDLHLHELHELRRAQEYTTILELRVDADVRRRAEKVWSRAMALFWRRFGSWCERAIPNNWLR